MMRKIGAIAAFVMRRLTQATLLTIAQQQRQARGGVGGWAQSGNFHSNWQTGTAVSSDDNAGYINLGDGQFASWER